MPDEKEEPLFKSPRDRLHVVPDPRNCNKHWLVTSDKVIVGAVDCIVGEALAKQLVEAFNTLLDMPPEGPAILLEMFGGVPQSAFTNIPGVEKAKLIIVEDKKYIDDENDVTRVDGTDDCVTHVFELGHHTTIGANALTAAEEHAENGLTNPSH